MVTFSLGSVAKNVEIMLYVFFIGKAALERLLQGSVKLESRSTPVFMRYDKKGNWAIAKDEFRAVVDKGTVRTRADRKGRVSSYLSNFIHVHIFA